MINYTYNVGQKLLKYEVSVRPEVELEIVGFTNEGCSWRERTKYAEA